DAKGAERMFRAGLRLLEEHRSALGAVELRATVSRVGSELSEQGLRIAVDSGSPERVLDWAERLRGNALRLPPVAPPADLRLKAQEAELRRLALRIREAEAAGRPLQSLASRQIELETSIRVRARHVRGSGQVAQSVPPLREVASILGDRALVE